MLDNAHNNEYNLTKVQGRRQRKENEKMTNLTIRLDEDIKQDAENLFEELGLSMSGAINLFIRQAIRERAIPFQIQAKTQEERYHEYFNPHNAHILKESIDELNKGKGIIKTVDELEAMLNE